MVCGSIVGRGSQIKGRVLDSAFSTRRIRMPCRATTIRLSRKVRVRHWPIDMPVRGCRRVRKSVWLRGESDVVVDRIVDSSSVLILIRRLDSFTKARRGKCKRFARRSHGMVIFTLALFIFFLTAASSDTACSIGYIKSGRYTRSLSSSVLRWYRLVKAKPGSYNLIGGRGQRR